MKFLELHVFSFLFSKLKIYGEKVQNKLSFAVQSRGNDEMEVGSVQLPRKVLLLRAARLLFVEKLDELNCRAEESSSSLSHHLLVVSSPRLNHPTSKLKKKFSPLLFVQLLPSHLQPGNNLAFTHGLSNGFGTWEL